MTAQEMLWAVAGAALAFAVVAAMAEHRRSKRPNLDRVGWVPWNLLQILSALAAVTAAALSIKT